MALGGSRLVLCRNSHFGAESTRREGSAKNPSRSSKPGRVTMEAASGPRLLGVPPPSSPKKRRKKTRRSPRLLARQRSQRPDSNRRPVPYEGTALPTELRWRGCWFLGCWFSGTLWKEPHYTTKMFGVSFSPERSSFPPPIGGLVSSPCGGIQRGLFIRLPLWISSQAGNDFPE